MSVARLVCVEDLFTAMLQWDKTDLSVDPETFRDIYAIVRQCDVNWGSNLCDYHVQCQLMNGDGGIQYHCSMALVKGAVSMMRKWVTEKKVDESVRKLFGDAGEVDRGDLDLHLLGLQSDATKSGISGMITARRAACSSDNRSVRFISAS